MPLPVDSKGNNPRYLTKFIQSVYIADGLEEDSEELIKRCLQSDVLSFHVFCNIWKDMNLSAMYQGRQSTCEIAEVSEEAILIAKRYMTRVCENFEESVAGLFLVYAIVRLQPFTRFAPLRITPEDIEATTYLEQTARKHKRYDVLYILGSLLIEGPCEFHVSARDFGLEASVRKNFDASSSVNKIGVRPRGVFNHRNEEMDLLRELSSLGKKYVNFKNKISVEAKGDNNMVADMNYYNESIITDLSTTLRNIINGDVDLLTAGKKQEAPSTAVLTKRQQIKQKAMKNVVDYMNHLTGLGGRRNKSSQDLPRKKIKERRRAGSGQQRKKKLSLLSSKKKKIKLNDDDSSSDDDDESIVMCDDSDLDVSTEKESEDDDDFMEEIKLEITAQKTTEQMFMDKVKRESDQRKYTKKLCNTRQTRWKFEDEESDQDKKPIPRNITSPPKNKTNSRSPKKSEPGPQDKCYVNTKRKTKRRKITGPPKNIKHEARLETLPLLALDDEDECYKDSDTTNPPKNEDDTTEPNELADQDKCLAKITKQPNKRKIKRPQRIERENKIIETGIASALKKREEEEEDLDRELSSSSNSENDDISPKEEQSTSTIQEDPDKSTIDTNIIRKTRRSQRYENKETSTKTANTIELNKLADQGTSCPEITRTTNKRKTRSPQKYENKETSNKTANTIELNKQADQGTSCPENTRTTNKRKTRSPQKYENYETNSKKARNIDEPKSNAPKSKANSNRKNAIVPKNIQQLVEIEIDTSTVRITSQNVKDSKLDILKMETNQPQPVTPKRKQRNRKRKNW